MMRHLGDITKINGAEIPPVDVIIGGSPCQDLSVAGKREGLAGERSGLFMEQIRIVKEMRENDRKMGRDFHLCRPRYLVWENVCGALSSGTPKGEDFRIVLEEIARVCEPNAVIPRPDKWSNAGCIVGKRWAIAWRIHDAQFWGVAQRRRRISLVASFGDQSAGEICFVRHCVQGHFEPGEPQGEETSGDTRDGSDSASQTLTYAIPAYDSNVMKSPNPNTGVRETDYARCLDNSDPSCNQGGTVVCQTYGLDRASYNQGKNAQYDFQVVEEQSPTLVAKGGGAVATNRKS